jgi:hypothetical protein
MTVIVKNQNTDRQTVKPWEMIQGNAYEDIYGNTYICNKYSAAVAFSICGKHLIFNDSTGDYYDCTIEVNRIK